MIWKNKTEIPHLGGKDAQKLAAHMERLLAEANAAFDANDFLRAGDAMAQAALVAYGLAGIDAEAKLNEIIRKESN